MQKVNVHVKEVAYYTVVSTEQLKAKNYAAIAEIDATYAEVLKKIYVEYERLHILTNQAYELNLNASDRFSHSQELASSLQVDQDAKLKTDEDILAFFKE